MEKKVLGKSGLELTTVGVGTWAIGGADWQYGWGAQDDRDSIAAIHEALDLGINWVDTAAAYGLGHAEEIVGQALVGRRDKVIVATKCGLTWKPGATLVDHVLKAESVRAELEASLRRLRTDVIDLYQIHWPDPDADIEEGWTVIAKAVKEGKIRHGGVSNFNVPQMKRAHAIHPIASLQPPYNMLRRKIESDILPYCKEQGIGVICYSPMQMGLLTGAFSRERMASMAKNDLRSKNPHFVEPALTNNLALVDGLRPIAAQYGKSIGELAIAWVLRRPEVTAAIVGARRPGQIGELVGASGWHLSKEDIARIDSLVAEREAKG